MGEIVGVVKFWDLGRSRAKGNFKVIAKDEDDFNNQLYKEFSKYLISSEISFEDGKIYAGFRQVGYFVFLAIQKEEVKRGVRK